MDEIKADLDALVGVQVELFLELDDCTVEVMATWAGGNDSVTKGPRWPHDV